MKKNKMLFFDIECANIFNNVCKMCSSGYVITDEEFNVIEMKDIIIKPESKYNPYLFRENSKTRLAYSKKYYNGHYNFKSDYISIFGFNH